MKTVKLTLALACGLSNFACKKPIDKIESTAAQKLIAASSAKRPAIRHINHDGSQDVSGSKLVEPETLNNMITALLGQELENNPLSRDFGNASSDSENRYPVYLGSLDYHTVTERSTEVTSTMPLVMDRIAKAICEQAIVSGQLEVDSARTDQETYADELHKRLCSRPIDGETFASVQNILAVDADTQGWNAVCVFFLLKQGSVLIN
jgi:hypothetical protein